MKAITLLPYREHYKYDRPLTGATWLLEWTPDRRGGGWGVLGFEWVPTVKGLRRAEAMNTGIRGGQLKTKNTVRTVACLYSLYFVKYMTFIV